MVIMPHYLNNNLLIINWIHFLFENLNQVYHNYIIILIISAMLVYTKSIKLFILVYRLLV